MADSQLITYVREQLAAGVPINELRSTLTNAGWSVGDVAQALADATLAMSRESAAASATASGTAPAEPKEHSWTPVLWVGVAMTLVALVGTAFGYYYLSMPKVTSLVPPDQLARLTHATSTASASGSATTTPPARTTAVLQNGQTNVLVSYPVTLTPSVSTSTETLTLTASTSFLSTSTPSVSISVDQNTKKLSLQNYYDGNPGEKLGTSTDQSLVGGYPAFRFVPTASSTEDVVIIIPFSTTFVRIVDRGLSFAPGDPFTDILANVSFATGTTSLGTSTPQ